MQIKRVDTMLHIDFSVEERRALALIYNTLQPVRDVLSADDEILLHIENVCDAIEDWLHIELTF